MISGNPWGRLLYFEAGRECTPCNHCLEAARFGRAHGAMAADLAGRFKCARRGSKTTPIKVHPPTVRDMRTGAPR